MKYQKIIDRIISGGMSRAELQTLQKNAEGKLKQGDAEAQAVIDAINISNPEDDYVLFMGFCPNADFGGRQDIEWKAKGICEFDFPESPVQVEQFDTICAGDLVVLKKIKQFGKTMSLFGHGRVTSVAYDVNGMRYLKMDWAKQDKIIEVPLMSCNSTINIREMDAVSKEMPKEFFEWLEGK